MISGTAACSDEVDVENLIFCVWLGKRNQYVYELLDRKNQTSAIRADLVERFHKGLSLYKSADFVTACDEFRACLEIDALDGPAEVYLRRCQSYINDPPDVGWDGVFTLTEKG